MNRIVQMLKEIYAWCKMSGDSARDYVKDAAIALNKGAVSPAIMSLKKAIRATEHDSLARKLNEIGRIIQR